LFTNRPEAREKRKYTRRRRECPSTNVSVQASIEGNGWFEKEVQALKEIGVISGVTEQHSHQTLS